MGKSLIFLGLCILLAAAVISFALENSNKPEVVKIAEYQAKEEQVKLEKQEKAEQQKIEEINNSLFKEITEREGFSYFGVFDLPENEEKLVIKTMVEKGFSYLIKIAFIIGIINVFFIVLGRLRV